MAAIGILGFILSGVMYFNNIEFWKILIWLSWVFFVGGSLMLIIDVFIDGLFGLKIAYRFFANILGHKGYNIVVKNKSGNNVLEFFAEESEKSQIINFIKSLKKNAFVEINHSVPNESNNDNINKIEKLAELHKQGVLTDHEFQKMKKQLLGL
jgi:fructose-1-phosphate kinase PfkB-like protein